MSDINTFLKEYKQWSSQEKYKDFNFITKVSDKWEKRLISKTKFNVWGLLFGPFCYFGYEMYLHGILFTTLGLVLLCLLQFGPLWIIPYLLLAVITSFTINKIYLKHLEKIRKNYSNFNPDADTPYFNISMSRLVVLSLLTGGFYLAYWHYRNMKALKMAQNDDVSPFWSAFFVRLTSYDSFRAIAHSAKLVEYAKKFHPVLAAWLFFFLSGGVNRVLSEKENVELGIVVAVVVLDWLFVTLLTLMICRYQKAIRFYCESKGIQKVKGVTFWEVVLILLGLVFNATLLFLTCMLIRAFIFPVG